MLSKNAVIYSVFRQISTKNLKNFVECRSILAKNVVAFCRNLLAKKIVEPGQKILSKNLAEPCQKILAKFTVKKCLLIN